MSAWSDPHAAATPDLTVKGGPGLQVADASIMPMDCRANTHMIGEWLAGRLKAEGRA